MRSTICIPSGVISSDAERREWIIPNGSKWYWATIVSLPSSRTSCGSGSNSQCEWAKVATHRRRAKSHYPSVSLPIRTQKSTISAGKLVKDLINIDVYVFSLTFDDSTVSRSFASRKSFSP